MANNKAIQILRGSTTYDPSNVNNTELLDGQLFYSKKNKQLYIGDKSYYDETSTSYITRPIGAANLKPGKGKGSIVSAYTEGDWSSSKATGLGSIAFGNGNDVSGTESIAFGSNNMITNYRSVAFGSGNSITQQYSYLLGQNLKAENSTYKLVTGYYNADRTDSLLELGNGKKDDRSNALFVTREGNTYIQGHLQVGGNSPDYGGGQTDAGFPHNLIVKDSSSNDLLKLDKTSFYLKPSANAYKIEINKDSNEKDTFSIYADNDKEIIAKTSYNGDTKSLHLGSGSNFSEIIIGKNVDTLKLGSNGDTEITRNNFKTFGLETDSNNKTVNIGFTETESHPIILSQTDSGNTLNITDTTIKFTPTSGTASSLSTSGNYLTLSSENFKVESNKNIELIGPKINESENSLKINENGISITSNTQIGTPTINVNGNTYIGGNLWLSNSDNISKIVCANATTLRVVDASDQPGAIEASTFRGSSLAWKSDNASEYDHWLSFRSIAVKPIYQYQYLGDIILKGLDDSLNSVKNIKLFTDVYDDELILISLNFICQYSGNDIRFQPFTILRQAVAFENSQTYVLTGKPAYDPLIQELALSIELFYDKSITGKAIYLRRMYLQGGGISDVKITCGAGAVVFPNYSEIKHEQEEK